ncbi:hypothetical protein ACFVZH_02610 [Streptomyces sp. NPDC059534]|uniref:hypothetical protein n=1 Tax=Streptomyces sp. NPDC059534 TaxID=3346859 RepID=UPI0036802F1E
MNAPKLTVDRLLSAPLPELLAEVGAELVDSTTGDDTTLGKIEGRPGAARLTMPTGRSDFERDTIARILVGKLHGAPLRPVPASLDVRTYGGTQ